MERSLLQVTTALPSPVSAEALFRAAPGPRTLWEPRESSAPTLAGVGVAGRVDPRGPGRFAELRAGADALFESIEDVRWPGCDDAPPPMLLGGLAFSPRARWTAPWTAFGDGSFLLPEWLLVSSSARTFLRLVCPAAEGLASARARLGRLVARLAVAGVRGPEADRQHVPSEVEHMAPRAWRSLVVDALRRIADHELDKLVAARCSVVRTRGPIDVLSTLGRLRGPAQPGVLFAHERGGATFLGLTPERLVARRGTHVETEALAGTGTDPEALAASEKDLREHAIVVDGIRRALGPSCETIVPAAAPRVRALPGLFHLWTPLGGELARPTHVLELVQRLHPTAAVAGEPAPAAVAWIGAHEPVPRGWYAGPVGWFDACGDGDFAVAIRAGVVDGARAYVWAGAGIVPASDPDREYGETEVKQRAILGALGVTA